MRRLAASGPGSRVLAPLLHRLDRPVYRLTRGRTTLGGGVSGLPVALLTTTCARSGPVGTAALRVLPSSEGLALIASNWGRPGRPAWEHNVRAHRAATVSMFGTSVPTGVVEAVGERRERIWREALGVYPSYAACERRARGRRIGVCVLETDAP